MARLNSELPVDTKHKTEELGSSFKRFLSSLLCTESRRHPSTRFTGCERIYVLSIRDDADSSYCGSSSGSGTRSKLVTSLIPDHTPPVSGVPVAPSTVLGAVSGSDRLWSQVREMCPDSTVSSTTPRSHSTTKWVTLFTVSVGGLVCPDSQVLVCS